MTRDQNLEAARSIAIAQAVKKTRARPADIPGLWNVLGQPELTTNQLLNYASRLP